MAVLAGSLIAVMLVSPAVASTTSGKVPPNVDVSRRQGNESEEAVAVNPTNPDNVVIVTNITEGNFGMFEGVSFDGGQTWTRKIIAIGGELGHSCCDPSLSFDRYGNLFMTYL